MIRERQKKAAPKLTQCELNQIKLWEDNPRKNDSAVERLAEILKEHGQVTPVVVWRKNNVIYKGNTTYKAAKLLGWENIKVLYVDFKNEEAAKAYGIADNKASEWSEWDDELLSNILQSLEGYSEEFSFEKATGFTEEEFNSLNLKDELKGFNLDIKEKELKGKVQITIDEKDKDELVDWLKEELPEAGFTKFKIK